MYVPACLASFFSLTSEGCREKGKAGGGEGKRSVHILEDGLKFGQEERGREREREIRLVRIGDVGSM